MSQIYDIADAYVERLAAMDPIAATMLGIAEYDAEMSDYSPEQASSVNQMSRETLRLLESASVSGEQDRIAKECVADHLSLNLQQYDAGEHLRPLSILASPIHAIRMCFDLMPRETERDWENIASRLHKVGTGLASFRTSLQEGSRRGIVVSQRQVTEVIQQLQVWSGMTPEPAFFSRIVEPAVVGSPLRKKLEDGARIATTGFTETASFLENEYLSKATEKDAVGPDRYALRAREYTGDVLDLAEIYDWGWDQLAWVETEMDITAEKILPGEGIDAAKELLETDPGRAIEGQLSFQAWMQELQDSTIQELDGTHFDLPTQVKRIEAMLAPPGGALAMYYTGPSEDFSRPGRTWYPTGGKSRFPLWGEVSIAYHEGVPGHHFQIATTRHLKNSLSRFQRLLAGTSGYVEGWALYAERLMGELGYLENPDYYLGMLRAQALRSVRIIVDIGMHLELSIPHGQRFHPGAIWSPELGLDFVRKRSHFPPDFVASEVSRYLGIPGQAISYKVGERAWMDARAQAKQQLGHEFDLKTWHNRALHLGPMGLGQMRREMTRLSP